MSAISQQRRVAPGGCHAVRLAVTTAVNSQTVRDEVEQRQWEHVVFLAHLIYLHAHALSTPWRCQGGLGLRSSGGSPPVTTCACHIAKNLFHFIKQSIWNNGHKKLNGTVEG